MPFPFPFLTPSTIPLTPADLLNQLNAIISAVNNVPNILAASGTTPVSNGADTTDDVLQSFTIPANYFNTAGQTLRVTASGVTGATANNKQIKLKVGATTLLNSGTLTTNAGSWRFVAEIVYTGANAQMVSGQGISGTTVWAGSAAQTLTTGAAIVVNVTGASGTTGAAADVTCNSMIVEIIK